LRKQHVIVVGGGLAGLTCAIRLAEQGVRTTMLEAAPQPGGRTRSFYESPTDEWVDNGPHLLIGAYTATRKILHDCDADRFISWQPSLTLPLWDRQRGHFTLQPTQALPLPLAMPLAITRLPGHGWKSGSSLVRMAICAPKQQTVAEWMGRLGIPEILQRDLLEPLCLGALNEAPATADAPSFAHVLRESFANRDSARLGWFNRPLSEALIGPLLQKARQLGVDIQLRTRVTAINVQEDCAAVALRNDSRLEADAVILTIPGHARDMLLNRPDRVETRPITNIHLWFDRDDLQLAAPFIGGIGTLGQWFFDIRQQHPASHPGHFCVVISNHDGRHADIVRQVGDELADLGGWSREIRPFHHRMVIEQRATARVSSDTEQPLLPQRLIDACEAPRSGDLPATIEMAVRRGETAAKNFLISHA